MKQYIGSCSDDSIGIGYLLVGRNFREVENGDYPYEILVGDDWIPCYDIVYVKDNKVKFISE